MSKEALITTLRFTERKFRGVVGADIIRPVISPMGK